MRWIAGLPNNDLFLTRRFNGVRKVLIVHSVDLTGASDYRCLRKHIGDFFNNRAIWTRFERRRKDRRDLVVAGNSRQPRYICFEFMGIKVTDELDKSRLIGKLKRKRLALIRRSQEERLT